MSNRLNIMYLINKGQTQAIIDPSMMSRMTGAVRRVKVPHKADENALFSERFISITTDKNLKSICKHLIMSTAENQEHLRQMFISTTFGAEHSNLDKEQRQDWNRFVSQSLFYFVTQHI